MYKYIKMEYYGNYHPSIPFLLSFYIIKIYSRCQVRKTPICSKITSRKNITMIFPYIQRESFR